MRCTVNGVAQEEQSARALCCLVFSEHSKPPIPTCISVRVGIACLCHSTSSKNNNDCDYLCMLLSEVKCCCVLLCVVVCCCVLLCVAARCSGSSWNVACWLLRSLQLPLVPCCLLLF